MGTGRQGLSQGWLITIWIAYILSHADHRKSAVRDWANDLHHTLEAAPGRRSATLTSPTTASPLSSNDLSHPETLGPHRDRPLGRHLRSLRPAGRADPAR